MKKRKFIFGGLAGLTFIAFTAMNVTVSHSIQLDETVTQLSLTELTAEASSGGEYYCSLDKYGAGICTFLSGNICIDYQESCSLARFQIVNNYKGSFVWKPCK